MRRAALAAILAVFAFLHVYRMGELSYTWDEAGDVGIVECLQRSGNPFACLDDISQTRLPFYLHALFGAHYWISFAFSAITLLAVYWYARREHGEWTALLFAALYTTSPALLAGGRMVLTHSSMIFTCFTTLSFLALMRMEHSKSNIEKGRSREARPFSIFNFQFSIPLHRRWFYACAVLTGLAAASHILAALNAIFLLAFYCTRFRPSWRDLWFIPVAAATFFATTIVYLSPPILRELIDACLAGGGKYPFWNYLGLGSPRAPWFFPFLLLAIKVGPWLVFALHRQARWFLFALSVNLVLKGTVFGYETPHHQVQFYPLLYLFIAVGIMRSAGVPPGEGGASSLAPGGTPPAQPPGRRRSAVGVFVVVLFAVQIFDIGRFFPNYLFYGAQYGERVIGEFYGPAVLHAQGRTEVWQVIDAIRVREPEAKILVADHNMFDAVGPEFVPFTKRDPDVRYRYALVDRLYATHFHLPERDAYNAFLARHYRTAYVTEFPTGVWVYKVMELHDPATPSPAPPGHAR